ncbi:MAG: hypothetical protein ABEI86_02185, partial [Halobacteriaceae archaeon]
GTARETEPGVPRLRTDPELISQRSQIRPLPRNQQSLPQERMNNSSVLRSSSLRLTMDSFAPIQVDAYPEQITQYVHG